MLGRVNAGYAHFFAVLGQSGLTELSTHFRQQRILYGFRQIRGFNLGRIDLPAGGPGHPDRNLMTPSMQGHGDFGFQRITGIHDQIALRQMRFDIVGGHEVQGRGYLTGRIDRSDPFSQGIGLIQPIISHQRRQLSVGVGYAQVIQINQIDGSNATTRKRLGHPTADTSHAHNGHASL